MFIPLLGASLDDAERCFNWPNSCTTQSFSSPNYPNPYPDRYEKLYQLYVPSATSITLTFQELFSVEANKDELYIGTGLGFDPLRGFGNFVTIPGQQYFFEGTEAPNPITLNTDTIWIYFLTDKNNMREGWSLSWTASKYAKGLRIVGAGKKKGTICIKYPIN